MGPVCVGFSSCYLRNTATVKVRQLFCPAFTLLLRLRRLCSQTLHTMCENPNHRYCRTQLQDSETYQSKKKKRLADFSLHQSVRTGSGIQKHRQDWELTYWNETQSTTNWPRAKGDRRLIQDVMRMTRHRWGRTIRSRCPRNRRRTGCKSKIRDKDQWFQNKTGSTRQEMWMKK